MAIRAAQGHQLVFVNSAVGCTISRFLSLKSGHVECYKNYNIQETPFPRLAGKWVTPSA
jgi:hypothetical protein